MYLTVSLQYSLVDVYSIDHWVRVCNLSKTTCVADLKAAFSKYGKVRFIDYSVDYSEYRNHPDPVGNGLGFLVFFLLLLQLAAISHSLTIFKHGFQASWPKGCKYYCWKRWLVIHLWRKKERKKKKLLVLNITLIIQYLPR